MTHGAPSVADDRSSTPDQPAPDATTFPDFEQVICGEQRARDVAKRQQDIARRGRIVTVLLLLAGLLLILYPHILQTFDTIRQSRTATDTATTVAAMPPDERTQALADAREYNAWLASSGQVDFGADSDPFAASPADPEDTPSSRDSLYQGLLNVSGDGIMGSVSIPKISLTLPIYHGTSARALNSGAGHMYGTSLPVGGADTHAVITGHRGMVSALMFTRIDEMAVGDTFTVTVMGQTLTYEVDEIDVIAPTDGDRYLRIRPGEDRVTLMTCTPYGVNTHRLLVSGHRVDDQSPTTPAVRRDVSGLRWAMGIAAAVAIPLATLIVRRRYKWMPMRHAADRKGW